MIGDVTLICTVCQAVYQVAELTYDFPDEAILNCCGTALIAVQHGKTASETFTGADLVKQRRVMAERNAKSA